MAVRFTASTQNYTATNGLPGNVYTTCLWIWATSTSVTQVAYWLRTFSDVFTGIQIRDVGNLQAIDSGSYAFNGLHPLAISANTWYRAALVVNGANATFYRSAAGAALSSGSVSDFTVPAAPQQWTIGDDPYDDWLRGRLAAFKAWNAALTAAEVETELGQYVPSRTANLIRWHPFLRAETVDYSGAANSLSDGTGATTEDGPPIPWRAANPRIITPTVAAAGSANLTPATVTVTAVPVTPVPGAVTVNLTPGVVSAVAQPLTALPGQVTVNLTPAAVTVQAVPLMDVDTDRVADLSVRLGRLQATGHVGRFAVTAAVRDL